MASLLLAQGLLPWGLPCGTVPGSAEGDCSRGRTRRQPQERMMGLCSQKPARLEDELPLTSSSGDPAGGHVGVGQASGQGGGGLGQAWRPDAARSTQGGGPGEPSRRGRRGVLAPLPSRGWLSRQLPAGTPEDPGTRGRAGRACVARPVSSAGPWDKSVPSDRLCPGQASWWAAARPSTMETAAPRAGCPTWGPRPPPAPAGRPWSGPSTRPPRSCCAGLAARRPAGSASARA